MAGKRWCHGRTRISRQLDETVQMCVTSPPYFGLRDYGHVDQIGLEQTPSAYVERLVEAFREVRRVLKPDGTLWLNIGDSYANDGKWGGETGGKQSYLGDNDRKRVGREKRLTGLKPKDLIGIPWAVAFALRSDGWHLRSDIIWSKPAPMPESVTDRPTKSHEYLFLLAKSQRYYYNAAAIAEPATNAGVTVKNNGAAGMETFGDGMRTRAGFARGIVVGETRNKRSVWTIPTRPYADAHFATFPPALVEPCILAGSRPGDLVLDPFIGSGTTGAVAERLMRRWVGTDLAYQHLSAKRTQQRGLRLLDEVGA